MTELVSERNVMRSIIRIKAARKIKEYNLSKGK